MIDWDDKAVTDALGKYQKPQEKKITNSKAQLYSLESTTRKSERALAKNTGKYKVKCMNV